MTSDWRPSTPELDAETLRDTLRENAVVAIHIWASWAHSIDRELDDALRPLREELSGRVAFRSLECDSAAGATLARDTRVLNVPTLSIWVRGRFWRNHTGVRPTERLRTALEEAVRRSTPRSENLEVLVREPDLSRIARWGEGLLGDLKLVRDGPEQTVYHSANGRAFCLTPRMQDTDFTSVWMSPTAGGVPFTADIELAREAHRLLGVEALCCVEALERNMTPTRWWSVSGNGERTVNRGTLASWDALDDRLYGLCARHSTGLGAQLADRHSEPHRAYHTMLHLNEAHDALWECRGLAERLAEIQIALWFHDAIYDTRRHDNEERSADWARDELLRAGAAPEVADRVHALVLATKHRDVPEGNDARLLVDADLSILAAPPDRFAAYERQIRQEYDWVPEPQFREARERFLRGMLARPSIFSVPEMRERHEVHARRNIEDSLRRLGEATPPVTPA